MAQAQIAPELKLFLEELRKIYQQKNTIPLKILLFGSRAKGNACKESDFNVCLVVRDTTTADEALEYSIPARILAGKLGIDADVVIMAASDIAEHTVSPLGFEIWKNHLEI